MNHIVKALQLVRAKGNQHVYSASKVISRFSSSEVITWNKYWKPGPYPKTEEERIAAAQKYNMLPEDYEPYPENESFGDYPKFPPTHMENLSDHELYDYPIYKRNHGEPIHPEFDICIEDRVNFQKEHRTPMWKQYLYVISFFTIYSSILIYEEMNPTDLRMVPKQYPYKGSKAYTFEPVE